MCLVASVGYLMCLKEGDRICQLRCLICCGHVAGRIFEPSRCLHNSS